MHFSLQRGQIKSILVSDTGRDCAFKINKDPVTASVVFQPSNIASCEGRKAYMKDRVGWINQRGPIKEQLAKELPRLQGYYPEQ